MEPQWSTASASAQRATAFGALGGWLVSALVIVPVVMVGDALASGVERYVIVSAVMLMVAAPAVYAGWRFTTRAQTRSHQLTVELEEQLREAITSAEQEAQRREAQVHRQDFEASLSNALEMSDTEAEVLDVVEQALASTLPNRPAELLLADNSRAHLIQMAVRAPEGAPPGCRVSSPNRCPAARRAQVQQFDDSDALDACPKLRHRQSGSCSAVCVPVSIMGRTVGVIHSTSEAGATVDGDTIADLSALAKLAGTRIGLLRMMAETQLQAATDSLTGLLNRRSFENKVHALRPSGAPLVIAMADLDHFKDLNDKHGHETGDRALRICGQVFTRSLRPTDLVARHGGEEFAIALPASTLDEASAVLTRVQETLKQEIVSAGLPVFTVSVGLAEAEDRDEDLAQVLARADEALFIAKREGRDRIIVNSRRDGPSQLHGDDTLREPERLTRIS